jgi:4-amino-4-deoxy-L-arabinose transferase-like glycosyltransferase
MESATHPQSPTNWSLPRLRDRLGSLPLPRPELAALLVLAGLLNLWALGQNGWANEYYSAAVRSMSGSWHDFLFGSFDAQGLMTVDKPPLALWVQALSVKAFGFDSLAILVPQALMGVASVGLLYDLVRRRFGRQGGFVAGLVLALTPIAVAVSRHNNPDALLVLCCVGALWAFVRALEDGRSRWLVLAGVCVGLGFEAKMGVALMVVPGMALAWLWVAPRGRMVALRQLLVAGAAMVAVGLAWAVMVELTPASSRPWVAGTSDNSVFSLILEYNGFGRLDGQAGGPGALGGGGGGGPFGGSTGPLRLLNEALGGQAGWLLGLALVGAIGIAAFSRLRRDDERTGWLIAVGGAFAVTAVAFSFASGIFHPYYVSLLAPFSAALVGATFAQVRSEGARGRALGAVAIGAGAVTELIVIGNSATDLGWLVPVIVIAAAAAAIGLAWGEAPAQLRRWALVGGVAVLLVGPAIWSVQTLGHATSGTFPAGGPESASMMGGPGGGMGGPGGGAMPGMGGGGMAGAEGGSLPGMGGGEGGAMPGFGGTEMVPGGGGMPEGIEGMVPGMGGELEGMIPGMSQGGLAEMGALPGGPGEGTAGAMAGGPGGADLTGVLAYTESHGGGTIAVESQSEASASIIESGAEVAGIGGFSGKETSVSAEWLEERIESGQIRWILSGGGMTGPGGIGGDTRSGSESAIQQVTKTCTAVESSQLEASAGTLYDCARRALVE